MQHLKVVILLSCVVLFLKCFCFFSPLLVLDKDCERTGVMLDLDHDLKCENKRPPLLMAGPNVNRNGRS